MKPRILPLLALALLTTPAHASPVDLFGFGARGGAMAGAVVSTARGFESAYYNPAGIAFDENLSFAIGYQYAGFTLEADGQEMATRDAPMLNIGFGVPIPFGGVLEDRLAFSVGFVLPQSSIFIADIKRPGEPTFIVLENRAQTVSIMAGLGIRIADWLSVGIGTLALAELEGAIGVAPTAEGTLGASVRDELLASYSLTAGLIARPTDWLSVGLTYRGASRADFALPIVADLGESFGIPLPLLDVSGTAQYDPAEVAIEVSGHPIPWLLVGASVVWQQWSEFPLPVVYTAVPEGTPAQPPPNFEDTVSIRLGVEAELDLSAAVGLVPRLGFAWEPTPTPDQTGFHNHLDGDRAIAAFGVGVRWDALRIELAGQYHHIIEQTAVKSGEALEGNAGYPKITSSGHIIAGVIELGIDL